MHDSRSDPGRDPVACSLDLSDLNARRETLLPGLVRRATRHEELPDGCRWTFLSEPGLLEQIARAIEGERHCCRFLAFTISAPQAGGPITVEARGPAGTREFLQDLTGPVAPGP